MVWKAAPSTQVFNLLFSSYEAALNHFRELQDANDQLRTAYEQIEAQSLKLKELALVDEFVVLITDENDTSEGFLKARLETSLDEFNSGQCLMK
ncbi:MAG: hypothetical protein ACLPVO_09830 [Desulfomonilaceae bacterium]